MSIIFAELILIPIFPKGQTHVRVNVLACHLRNLFDYQDDVSRIVPNVSRVRKTATCDIPRADSIGTIPLLSLPESHMVSFELRKKLDKNLVVTLRTCNWLLHDGEDDKGTYFGHVCKNPHQK